MIPLLKEMHLLFVDRIVGIGVDVDELNLGTLEEFEYFALWGALFG